MACRIARKTVFTRRVCGLQLLQDFLEAVESGDPGKDEVVSLCELVLFGEGCEESCGIPIDVAHVLSVSD